jgi:fructose-1,6-bisphosphatase
MKKLICLIVLAIVSFNLYSQEMQPVKYKPVKTDYLAKSKKQRTAGWILTGTGTAVFSIGVVVSLTELAEASGNAIGSLFTDEEIPETASKGGTAITLTGLAMVATGITFLSIAKKNKRKAFDMSFINESSQQLRYNTVMNTSVPSVRLRLQF